MYKYANRVQISLDDHLQHNVPTPAFLRPSSAPHPGVPERGSPRVALLPQEDWQDLTRLPSSRGEDSAPHWNQTTCTSNLLARTDGRDTPAKLCLQPPIQHDPSHRGQDPEHPPCSSQHLGHLQPRREGQIQNTQPAEPRSLALMANS